MAERTGYRVTYDSISELHAAAEPWFGERARHAFSKWAGLEGGRREVKRLARDGWDTEAAQALDIADGAVDSVAADLNLINFRPLWDVSGCEVDVSRYLSGEPENMIDYEIVQSERAGRVIVLCASVSFSGALSVETVKQRGHMIAALAFALNRLGLNTELWADMTSEGSDGQFDSTRVLVKGANDELDPARIMFAYAHPAMLRTLCLSAMHAWPKGRHAPNEVGGGYGKVSDPIEDMPEGTIYLPSLRGLGTLPKPAEFIEDRLRSLGLIE